MSATLTLTRRALRSDGGDDAGEVGAVPEGVEVAQGGDPRAVGEVGAVDDAAGERADGRDAGVDERDVDRAEPAERRRRWRR